MKQFLYDSYLVLFASYLVFGFAEYLRPGFVMPFFSVHIIAGFALLALLASLLIPSSSKL